MKRFIGVVLGATAFGVSCVALTAYFFFPEDWMSDGRFAILFFPGFYLAGSYILYQFMPRLEEPLMNQAQRVIIYLGIIALITMALIPPWTHTAQTHLAYAEDPVGYQFIGSPPEGKITSNLAEGYKIDLARIGLQFTVVIACMGFGVLATANRKKE